MTRRNDKRNQRRNRSNKFTEDQAVNMATSMAFGAIMNKIFGDVFDKKAKAKDLVESEVSDNVTAKDIQQLKEGVASLTKVKIPTDGSAIEFPLPDNLQIFISEDGKPMIRKKVEHDGEPAEAQNNLPTYEDIAEKLFKNKEYYYHNGNDIEKRIASYEYQDVDNSKTEAQVKRMLAFNKLQNIAQYLNDGWHPNFTIESEKWFIYLDGVTKKFAVASNIHCMGSGVHFKTKELAEQAIQIMGEESLSDLFNVNW